MAQTPAGKQILTVSLLTQSIRLFLESNFAFVWVEGEISNLRTASSGTTYFTLKDDKAQVRAVLFKLNRRYLRFQPQDGMHIVCQGRISVYDARGDYQLIIDHMEPRGIGALQQAFLQLRDRLDKEGLFAAEHKKKLPLLPRRVAVISSTRGAALYDFLRTALARFPNMPITVYPARVQGEGAAREISEGIHNLSKIADVDVIVLARGGGSFEDLWAFNEEVLARAIFDCDIPIVSAIGHEIDFTIADFVSDARVATPTAAAELVVPGKEDLLHQLDVVRRRLTKAVSKEFTYIRESLAHSVTRLVRLRNKIEDGRLRLDNMQLELRHNALRNIHGFRRNLESRISALKEHHPKLRLEIQGNQCRNLQREFNLLRELHFRQKREELSVLRTRLEGVNPSAILSRGYSITQLLPDKKILKDAEVVQDGMQVKVKLYRGELLCEIKEHKI